MKVLICGHFGFKKTLNNGQTIKTRMLFELIDTQKNENDIVKTCDTHNWLKFLLFKLISLVIKSIKADHVFILPAQNGVKFFIPFFAYFKKIFKNKKIHYVVIGGWLPEMLEKNKKFAKKLCEIDHIYVETKSMMDKMQNAGLTNLILLPNFKNIESIDETQLKLYNPTELSFCTFSRVSRSKGIEDAIRAVAKIAMKYTTINIKLDIYGQVEDTYSVEFSQLIENHSLYTNYLGNVPASESVNILKLYDYLLFPSYYEGEGFPGTFIDAFCSGLPVIASDWKYNSEIIIDGVNGFIFETRNVEGLVKRIDNIIQTRFNPIKLKHNCLEYAKIYSSRNAYKIIKKQMK